MKQKELCISTNTDGSEIVADILWELCAQGVIIYDESDLYKDATWDYIDENATSIYASKDVKVKGYLVPEDEEGYNVICSRIEELKEFSMKEGIDYGSLEITTALVDDDKWRDVWKEYFKPQKNGNIVVCPEWEEYDAKDDEKVLIIDPGLAFGTGEHETTSMVINLMQEIDYNNKSVIDIGCGSGILGICACLLGAKHTLMIDNDEQAVRATVKNLELNGITDNIEVQKANLTDNASGQYEVALANLTADILFVLNEDITKCLKENAYLVMSGIIESKYQEVIGKYQEKGFKHIKTQEKGEWRAVIMQLG